MTGLIAGDKARDTHADQTPRDEYNGFSNVQPRWLYAQWRLPFGIVRVGQQPNHWGMGILANDGDHPTLFGDYRYGSISERILIATKPGGKDSDFYLAVAGDLVFRDQNARLSRGPAGLPGRARRLLREGPKQARPLHHVSAAGERQDQRLARLRLHRRARRRGDRSPREDRRSDPRRPQRVRVRRSRGRYILGSTNFIRTADQALHGGKTEVRSYGGAARIGVVRRAWSTGFWRNGARPRHARRVQATSGTPSDKGVPYGDVVAQLEVGYASGDADPYDGTQRRFVFDPNHRVGLLLFDEVLRFQTARSATAAADPLLTNGRGQRPASTSSRPTAACSARSTSTQPRSTDRATGSISRAAW